MSTGRGHKYFGNQEPDKPSSALSFLSKPDKQLLRLAQKLKQLFAASWKRGGNSKIHFPNVINLTIRPWAVIFRVVSAAIHFLVGRER